MSWAFAGLIGDAEAAVRHLGRAGVRARILRIPGMYAPDREGGTPRARLLKGTPVLEAADDVFTNHIHADDLARACMAALWRGRAQRVYNVSDGHHLRMGDYFDLAADLYWLPRPPRIARSAAKEQLPLVLLSFMSESRRLDRAAPDGELVEGGRRAVRGVSDREVRRDAADERRREHGSNERSPRRSGPRLGGGARS